MTNAGMRLAAPAFIWGLSFITIVSLRPHLARAIGSVKNHGSSKTSTMPRKELQANRSVQANLPT
jgi:hypothetical protein